MTTTTKQQSQVRTVVGEVVSNAMDKTIVVLVVRRVKHKKYGKYIKRSSKMHAHDENNECQVGDKVIIKETRPYSKTKTWVLLEVIERATN